MKAHFRYPIQWLAIGALIALVGMIYGCNSSGGSGPLPETHTYRVEGVLVNDLNTDPLVGDTALVAVEALRNDSALTDATISVGGVPLVFDVSTFPIDSVWSYAAGPTSLVETGAYAFMLLDAARFGDTLTLVVADTFRIDTYTGAVDSVNVGGQEMQLTWTGSANADGYAVAVVLEDSVNTGYGYSEYVTSQAPQMTIPPDAFRLDSGIGGEPDTGWYHIYVYGYTGLPDSALTHPLLPVPMPSSLGDNIDLDNLAGRLGAVSVTRYVRLHVVAQ